MISEEEECDEYLFQGKFYTSKKCTKSLNFQLGFYIFSKTEDEYPNHTCTNMIGKEGKNSIKSEMVF